MTYVNKRKYLCFYLREEIGAEADTGDGDEGEDGEVGPEAESAGIDQCPPQAVDTV